MASIALVATPLVVGPAGIADAATGATVSSFITTPDASQLLSPGPSQVFNTDGVRPGNMITIEPTQTFQTMDGFGASITDSSAALLYQLPVAQRTQVMESIFSPTAGTGMSFLRQPIGASDFTNEGNYSYNDIPSWQFRPTSNGYYQVVNRHAPISWDVAGGTGATGDGTTVHLWTYGGGTNQQWLPVSMGGGFYKFVARHSGKCLDVRDVSTSDGARLQQWTCSGGPAQSFRLS